MRGVLLHNARIVNEGVSYEGYVAVSDGMIVETGAGKAPLRLLDSFEEVRDLKGALLLPGVIDVHVHFREPGLTHKADIASESRAALAGGVTSYFEMPNTSPQTVSPEEWRKKMEIAKRDSAVNYAFFIGATKDNIELLRDMDFSNVPGVKLFLGSSTGNMLVEGETLLDEIFSLGRRVAAHCEDEETIRNNVAEAREKYGETEVPISEHPSIRSREACVKSTASALERAIRLGTDFHVCHLTTREEVDMLRGLKGVSGEACVAHLWFCDEDYEKLGAKIKCNPSIKKRADREALRNAVRDGVIDIVATDHAPHLAKEKEGGALKAVSGMPMVQFSLQAMLALAEKGCFSIERVVEVMCHNPASRFGLKGRGFIRKGYHADMVILSKDSMTVTKDIIESKCGWSPLEGETFPYTVREVIVNGVSGWRDGKIMPHPVEALTFTDEK